MLPDQEDDRQARSRYIEQIEVQSVGWREPAEPHHLAVGVVDLYLVPDVPEGMTQPDGSEPLTCKQNQKRHQRPSCPTACSLLLDVGTMELDGRDQR
jgi:hypothetical protein